MKNLRQRIIEILTLAKIEKRWRRFARTVAVAVVFCTTYMLILPALTMENETYCGLNEHTHSEECYQLREVLVCGYDIQVHTATDAAADTGHTHTDACFTEKLMAICGLKEHTHSEYCIIEELAARNNSIPEQEDWEAIRDDYISSLSQETAEDLSLLSDEDADAVLKVTWLTEGLPDAQELYETLDKYYYSDDEEGEAAYFLGVQNLTVTTYCNYQNLGKLQKYVFNSDKMFELLDIFNNMPQTYTTGTGKPITFNYINNKWDTVAPVVVHGGTVGEKCPNASNYWHAVVVEYDSEHSSYYVSNIYLAEGGNGNSVTIKSLKAATSKGFVLVVWSADSGATTAQKAAANQILNVETGDTVIVSTDPTKTSSGAYKSAGYGTVTFKQGSEIDEELEWYKDTAEASDSQVVDGGGRTVSTDRNVTTTKTINGTSEENVFDITLTVETYSNIQTFLNEPDMAVVIVMDISNTMNSKYPSGASTTRYDAAVSAAEDFIYKFRDNTAGLSQIGFVAFNTHGHEIFDLQPCSTDAQAEALVSEMKTDTEAIIDNYVSDDWERFTNVEAGLKMGYDMIKDSGNSNQYIIFLSDGFPTTYLVDGTTTYQGYNTYTPSGTKGANGVFYDYVTGYYCSYGTSYSDKASIRARQMATQIKDSGAKIFSIGVDVGGQTIAGYDGRTGLSVIDRTGTTYEIGDAKSKTAYQNWLKNSIGSGYYYDSTAKNDIANAFDSIFAEIKDLNEQTTKTVWTATDPMPVYDEEPSIVGFIHFYDKDGNPVGAPDPESVNGAHTENGENTAYHEGNVVHWDLKKSGYTSKTVGNTTTYYYKLKYRVRLVNEKDTEKPFEDGKIYETNGDAYLEYRSLTTSNGVQNVSELKNVSFSKPAVTGYLGELSFTKVNSVGSGLPGAVFTLTHDDSKCTLCHGDGTALTDSAAHNEIYLKEHFDHAIGPYTATSDENGTVTFERIPSGHIYILTETVVPNGFKKGDSTYTVAIAYDTVTVSETDKKGVTRVWNGINDTVTNYGYVLPETGGSGTVYLNIIGGLLIALSSVFLICKYRNDRERRRKRSKV